MIGHQSLDRILEEIEQSGLLTNTRRVVVDGEESARGIEGEVIVKDRQATIRIVLPLCFPCGLPDFYLIPWDALGFIPHLAPDGRICLSDTDSLLINRHLPLKVVDEAFRWAISVLEDGVTGRNHIDFIDEFAAYWALLKGGRIAYSILEPGDRVSEISIALENTERNATGKTTEDHPVWVAGSATDYIAFQGVNRTQPFTNHKAIFIPLTTGALSLPPRHDRPFWDTQTIREIVHKSLSRAELDHLRKLVDRSDQLDQFIVLSLPRPSGGVSLFGIQFSRIGDHRPLQPGGTAERILPIQIQRVDREYLIPRGGGAFDVSDRRIVLFGCGSIGSFLAFDLVRAGIRNITLVDPDVLSPENTYRHALGRQYWGKAKVEALKEALEVQFPDLQVQPLIKTLEESLNDRSFQLDNFDLAIAATGDPSIELYLNERIHASPHNPFCLYVWVEPHGIGGHALLTHNSRDGGCFECLFTPVEEEQVTLENRASFAGPGQRFSKDLSGCGSRFTPYGAADAQRSAALAATLTIDALTGREHGNPLRSWKGDPSAFAQAGFQLSPRFDFSDQNLFDHRYDYRNRRCPICASVLATSGE